MSIICILVSKHMIGSIIAEEHISKPYNPLIHIKDLAFGEKGILNTQRNKPQSITSLFESTSWHQVYDKDIKMYDKDFHFQIVLLDEPDDRFPMIGMSQKMISLSEGNVDLIKMYFDVSGRDLWIMLPNDKKTIPTCAFSYYEGDADTPEQYCKKQVFEYDPDNYKRTKMNDSASFENELSKNIYFLDQMLTQA